MALFPEVFSSQSMGLPRIRLRIYTPLVTLMLAVCQQLARVSCRETVYTLTGLRAAQGLRPPSASTAAFCKAKAGLPLELIEGLIARIAAAAVKGVGRRERWLGHRVKLLDGTTFSMPDQPPNAQEWPQPPTQKPGQGFPQARVVALFCLATGAMLGWVTGRYRDGEATMARQLLSALQPGDVLVRDRGFAGYAFMHELLERRVHTVTRLLTQVKRLRTIGRLGPHDRLVELERPRGIPPTYSKEQWLQLPARMSLRLVEVRIATPGLRTQSYTLVTTLLDPGKYTSAALASLYRDRWEVELDFRHIKTTMGAEMLRARSPEMIKRELRFIFLAYNLVRAAMVRASQKARAADDQAPAADPRRISFAGARSLLRQLNAALGGLSEKRRWEVLEAMLFALASQPVILRPGRTEPRAIKRRRSHFPRLYGKRHQHRQQSPPNNYGARGKKNRLNQTKAHKGA